MPVKVLRWMNPVRKVRKRWVPKRGPIMGRPQRQLLMPSTMLLTNSITIPRFSDAAVFVRDTALVLISINLPQKELQKEKSKKIRLYVLK